MPAVTPRQVLIIDDNLSLAENIAEILQIDGHITRVAGSAEEAFPNAREDEPDVVVTDYRLPGINGAAFVKQFLGTHTHSRGDGDQRLHRRDDDRGGDGRGRDVHGEAPGLRAAGTLGLRRLRLNRLSAS